MFQFGTGMRASHALTVRRWIEQKLGRFRMSHERLDIEALGDDFALDGTRDTVVLETVLADPEGQAHRVRVVRRETVEPLGQKQAQQIRGRALRGLTHPGMASYLGEVERKGDIFDVFEAPELLSEDHLSLRLTPAMLTDRLLEVLPALEELHGAGLIHGALSRSTIRMTPAGRAIIVGLDNAAPSGETGADLQALANYCAASLGAVPGIPVEVFLKTGNRRINRRLCSAIQGAVGEEGYEPVTSVTVFHDLISGKTKPGPVRTPPILTQNVEYAPPEDTAPEEAAWTFPTMPDITPTRIGMVAACMLAVMTVPFYAPETAEPIIADSDAAAVDAEHVELVKVELTEAKTDAPVAAAQEMDLSYFEQTWLSQLVPASYVAPLDTPPVAAERVRLDLTLFEAQTTAWAISVPEPVMASAVPIHVQPEVNFAPVALDLSLFKAQTSAWMTRALVVETEPEFAETVPVEPVLSTVETGEGSDVTEAVALIALAPVAAPSPAPTLPSTDNSPQADISALQLFESTPDDITVRAAPPVQAERSVVGRVLVPSELQVIIGGETVERAAPVEAAEPQAVLTRTAVAETPSIAPEHGDAIDRATSIEAQPVANITKASSSFNPAVGQTFRDCAACPQMVRVPSLNGSEARIAMATTETTVSQYRAFVEETGRPVSGQVRNAFAPGFEQTGDHPVTYVGLGDALAFAEWLSAKTGHVYRLPSLEEWEFAAKSSDDFSVQSSRQCEIANGADAALSTQLPKRLAVSCNDTFIATAPVRSFPANQMGLYDMFGNVAEWTTSANGTDLNISKGGSWMSYGTDLSYEPDHIERKGARLGEVGFRLVREL